MPQQSAQQRPKAATVSSPDVNSMDNVLSTGKLKVAATSLRRPGGQIKKLAFRVSPKLRPRWRPGLPSTVTQRKVSSSTQTATSKVAAIAAGIQQQNPPANSASVPSLAAPYKEVKTEIVPVQTEAGPQVNSLKLQGDYWEVTYERKTSMLEDTRGLRYLALLIRQAGQGPIYATELVALAQGSSATLVELEIKEPIIDSAAENRLIKRLEGISFERNSAAAQNNYERVAALDEEVDRITEELQKIRSPRHGRGSRATFNNSAEKARKAVSKAITETIAKMLGHSEMESLARHLSTSIQKGQWLSYNGSAVWAVQFQLPSADKSHARVSSPATRKVAAAKAGNSK